MAHPPAEPLVLLLEERVALDAMASSPSLAHRKVREAKGLLLAADGVANTTIAERLGVSRSTVLGWRAQFVDDGVEWVGRVRPGRGRKPTIPAAKIDQVVHDTQHSTPADATHWSVRSMATHAGISKTKVQLIWAARGLKPHLVETQAVQRPSLRGEAGRRGRPVSEPSRWCGGVVGGREKPNPGIGSDPAQPAHETGPGRHHDP